MNTVLELYINEMLETKKESTVKNHKSTLVSFFNFVNNCLPIEVLPRDVVEYRNTKHKTMKTGTVNTMLKRVKLFFKWCVENELIPDSPAEDVKLLTESEQLPKWLDDKQEQALLRAVRKKYLSNTLKPSYREYAIIQLMLNAGLRVGEVCNLKWSDITIGKGISKVSILGKGDQYRTVPLIPELVEVLEKYKEVNGVKGEYVFYSRVKETITTRMVEHIVKDFSELKFYNGYIEELTPHMLRHTFAHKLAVRGMALEQIARLMGHMKNNGEPNIKMTIRYTKANDSEIANNLTMLLSNK